MSLSNSPQELELQRLARLVAVAPEELADLAALPHEDLQLLREQVASKLFDEGAESWDRVVAVSGAVPAGLAAKLAQGALGPVLSARVTGRLDVDRATDISRKLPPAFMADIAVRSDPRHITDLVAQMPPQTIAAVSAVLADRGEWLVMADFVAVISASALQTTVAGLDEASLLRIGVRLEDPARLSELVALLDDDRVAQLHAVAAAQGMRDHLDWITGAVEARQRERLLEAQER